MLDQLADLKKEHRTVFCTEVAGIQVVFRPLTWREHDAFTKMLALGLASRGKIEDVIFREIVLDPSLVDGMNQTPAGLVPGVVEVAINLSGNLLQTQMDMERLNADLEVMRKGLENNPFEQFILLICRAFPGYTPVEVEDLDFPEILRLLVMAEKILGLEEPIVLKPAEKAPSLTDRLFEDNKGAKRVDDAPPDGRRIDDLLRTAQQGTHSPSEMAESHEMARQQEVIRRIHERQHSG